MADKINEYGLLVFEREDMDGDTLRIYKREDGEHAIELVDRISGTTQRHHVPAPDRLLIAAFLIKEHPEKS